MRRRQKDVLGCLLLGLSAVMLCKSLTLCFSNDIWYDELFTVGMIEHSYGDFVAFTARDVHPPLYYCIVKLAVDFCKLISEQANPVVIAKMVSVLPYWVLFVYSVTLLRRRFGMFAGGFFLFCSIAMPQLSSYTVEVRMYSWALLFVTAAFLHGYCTVSAGGDLPKDGSLAADEGLSADGKFPAAGVSTAGAARGKGRQRHRAQTLHGAALVCYGIAAAYTHYFACVAVIMVYLFVLAAFWRGERRRIREWLVWTAASVLAYAPWLCVLYRQITAVQESYWILPLTWRSLGGCVKFLMKPAFADETVNTVFAVVLSVIYAVVFGTVALSAYSLKKKEKTGKLYHSGRERNVLGVIVAGIGVLAGLVLFGFAASALLRPIFVYRYMIPAMGCFWLSFALGVDCLFDRKKLSFTGIAACAVLLFVLAVGLRDYRAFMGEEEYKIRLMRETEEALAGIGQEDVVLYNFDQLQAVTSYYMDRDMDSYLWCGTPETLVQEIVRSYGIVEQTEKIRAWCDEGRDVWFLGSFNSREDIVEQWRREGLEVEETGSYLLERYWFNLYKIL